jgi:hypothetical protein
MDVRDLFPEDEPTDLTPRIVQAQRRANMMWLVGVAGTLLAAGGVTLASGTTDRTAPAAVEIEAERLAAAIDLSASSAHVQADGVAMAPMVRAGIETDTATMADIAKDEIHLSLHPGETLEVFQIRGTTTQTLLRAPSTVTAIQPISGHATRLENSGKGSLQVVAGSPIEPQNRQPSATRGEVAMSIPVDLALSRQRLSELVVKASLVGVGSPLALVTDTGSDADVIQLSFPVRPNADWKLPPMTLSAAIVSRHHGWVAPTRYACLALGGVMLAMFLLGLRRA